MSLHIGGSTISGRVTKELLQKIRFGKFKENTTLPSEIQLSKDFQVSRTVIRDALSNLEAEGFISRYRGIGTVIQRDIVNLTNRMDLKIEYNDMIRGLGGEPSSDYVTVEESTANKERGEKLEIPLGSPVLIREKRLLADGVPVLYSIDTISTALFQGKKYLELPWEEPIFDVLEGEFGIVIELNVSKIQPVNPNGRIQVMLQLPASAPVLRMEEMGYYKGNIPVLHTYAYYSDYFAFTLVRKSL